MEPSDATFFGGRKQSFWTWGFLNCQGNGFTLLEFDTEDQVLLIAKLNSNFNFNYNFSWE